MFLITEKAKIGNHFKREKIFLATLETANKAKTIIDIFYKEDNGGYTRFLETGPQTFSEENSVLSNIVPVWDYYMENELFEARIDHNFMAICAWDESPLSKYKKDFGI